MLEIEKLDPHTVQSIQQDANYRLRCLCPRGVDECDCGAQLLSQANDDGSECIADEWLLAYIATDRRIPYAWISAAFTHLARNDAYGERLRGYLLVQGADSLQFCPEPEPPVYRVLLDVSALGSGAAWDAWCDDPATALLDDGIDPQGMRDAYDAWDVTGATTEEEARAIVAPHLHSGVTIHSVTER